VRFSIERRAEPALLRMGRRIDILGDRFVIYGDKVGRAFGKGSRNDGLNLLGRSIGALVTGPMRLLVETAGKVSTALGTMGKDFNLARLDGLGFGAAMGKALQGGLKAGLPGLAALAAGIAALAVILPTTVALLFTLAGALTAVVGAITLGVLGGLLALVPVLASVVGGFVVLGVAFARAGKEGTRAARAVKSLKDAFRDFGESVADASNDVVEAFAGTAEKLLSQMTPFFVNMAEALTEVAKHFGKVLDDPAVKNFITEFSTVLPRVFENIGIGISNMIAGLLGFFAAILGPVENLSQGFLEMGERFREFATSADGQNKIAGWFDTAWEAAQDLWTILGNVFTILGKIFTSGTEGPGQGFLDYLVEVTEKFDKWLSTPEGKSALEDFFVRVEDLMKTAKDALEDFGEALDKLDTDKAAQDAQSFADAMGTLATGINAAATWLAFLSGALGAVASAISIPFVVGAAAITGAIDAITVGLEDLKQWFSENTVDIGSKEFAESALVAPFAWAYDQLFGNSWIPDIVNGFSEWIPQIPGIIASALAGVGEALVAPFRDAATNLLGILARLPGWSDPRVHRRHPRHDLRRSIQGDLRTASAVPRWHLGCAVPAVRVPRHGAQLRLRHSRCREQRPVGSCRRVLPPVRYGLRRRLRVGVGDPDPDQRHRRIHQRRSIARLVAREPSPRPDALRLRRCRLRADKSPHR
jgi:methyl-accepting chemotaxis protein